MRIAITATYFAEGVFDYDWLEDVVDNSDEHVGSYCRSYYVVDGGLDCIIKKLDVPEVVVSRPYREYDPDCDYIVEIYNGYRE